MLENCKIGQKVVYFECNNCWSFENATICTITKVNKKTVNANRKSFHIDNGALYHYGSKFYDNIFFITPLIDNDIKKSYEAYRQREKDLQYIGNINYKFPSFSAKTLHIIAEAIKEEERQWEKH